jgi:hypothetical protein
VRALASAGWIRSRALALPTAGVLVGIALLVPAGASAQSRTLGSPLSQAPNAGFGCETKPTFTDQSFNGDYFYLPSNQPDCTWFQSGVLGSIDYSDPRTGSVPLDGRITNVAVRSGPNPSALRIVIVRQIGGLAGGGVPTSGCCAFVSETPPAGSAPLQPQPNAVTNFAVDIPVERNLRGTSAVADFVGISGISGTGTLPLFSNGHNNTLVDYTQGNTDAGFLYPRLGALEGPGGGTRNNESIPGVELLVQWTWTPPGVPAGPPPGITAPPPGMTASPTPTPPAVGPAGSAAVRGQAARVTAGRALVKLICQGSAACEGQLQLLSGNALAAASRKPTVYGRSSYKLPAAGTATIKVTLNRLGRRLLRNRRSAKVGIRLKPTSGAPVTALLTLKR